jgi:hypothetical protein
MADMVGCGADVAHMWIEVTGALVARRTELLTANWMGHSTGVCLLEMVAQMAPLDRDDRERRVLTLHVGAVSKRGGSQLLMLRNILALDGCASLNRGPGVARAGDSSPQHLPLKPQFVLPNCY